MARRSLSVTLFRDSGPATASRGRVREGEGGEEKPRLNLSM